MLRISSWPWRTRLVQEPEEAYGALLKLEAFLIVFSSQLLEIPFSLQFLLKRQYITHTQKEVPEIPNYVYVLNNVSAFRFTLILKSVHGKWHLWNCQKEPNNRLVATESLWTGKT